jgi:hypothetical protein
MATLVLDPQQSQLVSDERGEIVVVDDSGRRLGILVAETVDDEPPPTLTAAQVELILERMKDPIDNLPTTAEVIQRIKARAGQ